MNEYFIIDKITNSIERVSDGTILPTIVAPFSKYDLPNVTKKNGWKFNWKQEFKHENRHLFKLLLEEDSIIQGLISIENMDGFIEMRLIETGPHNYGKGKQYYGVVGNLVAYACKCSFESGFEGYVSFKAKTKLVDHYIETLGAIPITKDRLKITSESARKLVNSYYKDFDI